MRAILYIVLCGVMFMTCGEVQGAGLKDSVDAGSPALRQYYSGMIGYYQPSDGLNNGLLIGVDGITEFNRYRFFLSGAVNAYVKKTFDIFSNPKPDIEDQNILLLPLHADVAYRLFEVPDAGTRGYIGVGAGYYFYFYSVQYRSGSGGLLGSLTTQSENKNGGNVFATAFARLLIGKIFVEPRALFATKSTETLAGSSFVINPSGFSVTLGFQYE